MRWPPIATRASIDDRCDGRSSEFPLSKPMRTRGTLMQLHQGVLCLSIVLLLGITGCSKTRSGYSVEEVPISRIASDLASGKTTAVLVTKAYIDRIKVYNRELNAVILVAPDVLEQAEASDARRKAAQARGPLEGIPVLIKDNI